MTHAELVERAARWLRNAQGCKPVFAEMVTAASTTPDAIGWSWGVSRLVEVKVSRADFFADRKKIGARSPGSAMGRRRWYMVPAGLVVAADLPPDWGLVYVDGSRLAEVLPAPERDLGAIAHAHETLMLASAIRRLTLGSRFDEKSGRWETAAGRMKIRTRAQVEREKSEAAE